MREIQTLNIENVIKSKSPKLYKALPNFVLRYLKKTIHEDELNYILTTYGKEYSGLDFNRKVIEYLNIKYVIDMPENLPPVDGRYMFVSNHPLGGLDGIVLIDALGEIYKKVKFVVNDLLMNLEPLHDVFIPVNKHGRQSSDYAKNIEDLYESDNQVLYFPAGLCSRKIKKEITDMEWKKSFVNKAIKSKRDIVPLFFMGRNSNFFYNLANIRKALGIKANIEQLYLSDELFKQKGAKFRIRVGKPISYELLAEMKLMTATNYVRKKVYLMKI